MDPDRRRVGRSLANQILPGLRSPVAQPDWVARFGVVLELLRFVERNGMSESIRAIESRRVMESLIDRITNEGLPQPNVDAFGEAFAAAFDRWLVDLVYWLRLPSRP
ncbi:MAG: hypothetical protein WD830_08595 [Chloroflexota bacterium]